ncbi:MAG TPA: EAL domain-containing protein [Clostridiales bacterium]|jgi:EAL domain-containing protein (putative c-di-GMP-specific phosphodiesterase class I)|nr:EAL domain-containing protein [Clostridiales bacterium]
MYELFSTLPNEESSDHSIKVEERHRNLQLDIKKAIALGQFRIHLQPIINLETYEIIGAEAFIRWDHHIYGTLLPEEFISIAEESKFILEMGDWVLNEVCRHYKNWMKEDLPPVKISVNVSSLQFLQKDFADHINSIINFYGLKPDFLMIEILERVMIRDYQQIKSSIEKLHEMGIRVALDDFGTGFSSMEYLSRLNIDTLKIDQLFVRPLPHDKTNSAIVDAILTLAKKLDILAIAEGIETDEQLDFLKKSGCRYGQGYYFSVPLPPAECKKLIQARYLIPKPVSRTPADIQDKRAYPRYKFHQYLEASMTILRCNGQDVNVGSTLVLIQDISGGGLCYYSTVSLPLKNNLFIKFSTSLLGRHVNLYGTPVWGKEVKNGLFKYGVRFRISEQERFKLLRLIEEIMGRTNRGNLSLEGDFILLSPDSYFGI